VTSGVVRMKAIILEEQLQAGKNLNTIIYDQESFTDNPELYFANPDQWEPAIRLIDWDE